MDLCPSSYLDTIFSQSVRLPQQVRLPVYQAWSPTRKIRFVTDNQDPQSVFRLIPGDAVTDACLTTLKCENETRARGTK